MSLEWRCSECGSHEPYESTGDEEYEVGDKDPCPDCNHLAVLCVAGQVSSATCPECKGTGQRQAHWGMTTCNVCSSSDTKGPAK